MRTEFWLLVVDPATLSPEILSMFPGYDKKGIKLQTDAAIFLRAAADMVRFDSFRTLAHLALCARAILRREAADIIRVGWFAFPNVPEPFSDSITVIT